MGITAEKESPSTPQKEGASEKKPKKKNTISRHRMHRWDLIPGKLKTTDERRGGRTYYQIPRKGTGGIGRGVVVAVRRLGPPIW